MTTKNKESKPTEPRLELLNKLRHDRQKNFARSVFVQRPKLVDGFFRAGFLTFKQVLYGSVALGVANLRIAGILVLHKVRIVDFIEHLLHIAECSSLFILVGCRTDAMIAIPVDVALDSFQVDVFAVGEVEIPIVVLGVIGAVGPGSSVVSCQLQINIPPFQHLGRVGAQQLCC